MKLEKIRGNNSPKSDVWRLFTPIYSMYMAWQYLCNINLTTLINLRKVKLRKYAK